MSINLNVSPYFPYVVGVFAFVLLVVLIFKRGQPKSQFKVLVYGMMCFGLVCWAECARQSIEKLVFLNSAQNVFAEVVSNKLVRASSGRHRTYYYATQLEFVANGESVRFVNPMKQSIVSFDPGQEVEIYFDPQNPYHAEIKGFVFQGLIAVIWFAMGLVCIVLGTILLIKLKQSARKANITKT